MKDVLLLSTRHTKTTQEFARNLEKQAGQQLRITYAAYSDLLFDVGAETRITVRGVDRDAASFDMVYFKTIQKDLEVAAVVASYLDRRQVPFVDRAVLRPPAINKLHQCIVLADHDIAVPRSIFLMSESMAEAYDHLVQELGLPFVFKDVHGKVGRYNFLINSRTEFAEAVDEARIHGISCIAQAFVENDCDYRVLVLGSKIGLVIRRSRQSQDTHLNNTSQGAAAELVPTDALPASVCQASVAAARLLDRQIAGVDFVQDKTSGLWYCLEVNESPQLARGSFLHEKQAALAAYLTEKER